ncbi:2-isopropylmalate synthase [Candidatus Woesearchaeota archaeon]|nr:2-isopropylmalate synthase [Candidatus Woesearchaeota archaeon]
MGRIKIFDTTLRDGEQSPGASLNIREKLIIAKQLARLNVDVIEAGFPIASQGDFDAVKLIAQKVKGPVICALARCMPADIDRAWEAIKPAKKRRIHVFIATSQIHMEKKLRISKEEVIKIAVEGIKRAKKYTRDVEFSPEDASRTDINYMCDVVSAAIKAGATTINIPDTVGYAEPEEFAQRITYLRKKVPESSKITISVHCHNDLGNAVANSLAAVNAGATQIECTINGLGERAGNASLEECVMNLRVRSNYFNGAFTSINIGEIFAASKLVSSLTGISVQRNKAIVGKNAFAHEAGIHQHGVISARETYEIMRASDVGWEGEGIVIGKHSGKHAVENVLKEMGYEFSKVQVSAITSRIKDLADKQKEVERADIIAIANDATQALSGQEQKVKLREFAIMTGSNVTPTATVKLEVDGKEKVGSATGVGPVDAASKAIKQLVDPSLKLTSYNLKAITGGTDALADVAITVENKNCEKFKAGSVNEDIVKASVEALIKGVNYALMHKPKKSIKPEDVGD